MRSELAPLLPKSQNPDQAIHPVAASPVEHGYRSSSKLCLHEDELGRRSIGLYERGSKKVVDIPQCSVHHPEINKLVERLFGFGRKLPARLYQHNKKGFQPGRLKFIVIRYSPETREFGLIISHSGVDRAALKAWASGLGLAGSSFYESELAASDDDLVVARNVNHLAGPETFRFQAGTFDFQIDPIAFFQANYSLAPHFIASIAAPHKGDILLDLYGGFGTYSFNSVQSFRKVHIVEANPHSISSAKDLAGRMVIQNLELSAKSVEDFLKSYMKSPEAKDVTDIIVNPPRTGLSRHVIEGLRSDPFKRLERMTYVSCDLKTLQRDLREIVKAGLFSIEAVLPFDMFPQTDHIENVVRLVRRSQPRSLPAAQSREPRAARAASRPPRSSHRK